ncbi:MAG TPA: CcdB family protein [Gammaproteobacteria bacterium]|jgi:toxin CcdB|nr:CcdB family protein [Gammaproteobacteria bacterium]HET7586649.1 CcdB family protein [Gammaproteobacteria bacterium]
MGQFAVHKNKNPKTCKQYPFLLDVQSDLLSDLQTRVIVPLAPQSVAEGAAQKRLTPVVHIHGESYLLVTPRLAGIETSSIGAAVADLGRYRNDIIAALDFLVTGI